MAANPFNEAWLEIIKENKDAWWGESDRNSDIDAAVDDNMAEQANKKKKSQDKPPKKNPTGNSTMDRMIARAKGNEPPRKESGRKPANLQSETLRRLHAKVKKD